MFAKWVDSVECEDGSDNQAGHVTNVTSVLECHVDFLRPLLVHVSPA